MHAVLTDGQIASISKFIKLLSKHYTPVTLFLLVPSSCTKMQILATIIYYELPQTLLVCVRASPTTVGILDTQNSLFCILAISFSIRTLTKYLFNPIISSNIFF
jgi:hypothetical protein